MNNLQKQFTEKNAPEGYWVDAKDAFIPVKMLKPIDLARDTLVGEIVTKAIELNKLMKQFKESSFGDIGAFVDLSANEYGVKLGGKKGNVTLYSFDGRYLIQRAMVDRIAFDERLQAAKELIDQCLADWTEGARYQSCKSSSIAHSPRINQVRCPLARFLLSVDMRLMINAGTERWKPSENPYRLSLQALIFVFTNVLATLTNICPLL